jgi:hypothetical protein
VDHEQAALHGRRHRVAEHEERYRHGTGYDCNPCLTIHAHLSTLHSVSRSVDRSIGLVAWRATSRARLDCAQRHARMFAIIRGFLVSLRYFVCSFKRAGYSGVTFLAGYSQDHMGYFATPIEYDIGYGQNTLIV